MRLQWLGVVPSAPFFRDVRWRSPRNHSAALKYSELNTVTIFKQMNKKVRRRKQEATKCSKSPCAKIMWYTLSLWHNGRNYRPYKLNRKYAWRFVPPLRIIEPTFRKQHSGWWRGMGVRLLATKSKKQNISSRNSHTNCIRTVSVTKTIKKKKMNSHFFLVRLKEPWHAREEVLYHDYFLTCKRFGGDVIRLGQKKNWTPQSKYSRYYISQNALQQLAYLLQTSGLN